MAGPIGLAGRWRMVGWWVIDDEGEISHYFSQRLRSKLRVRFLHEQDHIPLLRNLGFIGFRRSEQGILVTFRPTKVSSVAFAALAYLVHDAAPERFLLNALDAGLCPELYPSTALGLARIETLIEEHQSIGGLYRDALAFEAMPTSLRPAFDVWRVAAASSQYSALGEVLEGALGGRYLLAEPDLDGARIIIRSAGSGLHIPDAAWAKAQQGRPISDAPDKTYGRWTSEAYRTALASGKPQLDHIRASIRWSQTDYFQHRYTRLILPVIYRGRAMLLAVNNSTGGIRRHVEAA